MNCLDIPEQIKSCSWLKFFQFEISNTILTSPMYILNEVKNIQIENLGDVFDLYVVKDSESIIKVFVYRHRLSEKPDDGYALKFFFTIAGFDDETQSAIMKYDDERIDATFMLTENVLKKANSTHVVFDVCAVVKMLEFKSLDKNDPRKIRVDLYTSYEKDKLKKEEIEQLGCVLKNPEMEDVFTGRLSLPFTRKGMFAIEMMSKQLTKLAEYFKAKYNDKDSELPNFDVNKILNYIGLSNEVGPVPISEAIDAYYAAHIIGLDCLKIAASDYMAHILDKDDNVVHILVVALMVQDEDLIEKAILSFLVRFHKTRRSEIFEFLSVYAGSYARLMIHSLRVWVSNHDVFIPAWGQTAKPTTEL